MNPTLIEKQEIRILRQFYNLMAVTRDVRYKTVENLFKDQPVAQDSITSLKNALFSLEGIPSKDGLKILYIDNSKKIGARLLYEISELKKDIFFLENNEKQFIEYLENLHEGFIEQVNYGLEKLQGLNFNCFITDRDGTINNYCGRYISSVQAVYNSVFLTRFAKEKASNPIIITSAPLKNPGLVDVSVNPDKTFIYAASKGREYIDLNGERKTYPIEENKQQLLDSLNKRLSDLVIKPAFEMFSMIGSGLQFKFGQTTMHSPGNRPRFSEDTTKISGSGFPLSPSFCDTMPSTRVSKRFSNPASFKINLQFLLEDATPTLIPFFFKALTNFIDVSNTSGPSFFRTF